MMLKISTLLSIGIFTEFGTNIRPKHYSGVGRKKDDGSFRDNPRRLGKGWVRLVGPSPPRSDRKAGGGGRIHQFLWRRSRAVSSREKGTERRGAIRNRSQSSQVVQAGFELG
jgi:hypothetical protein